MLSSMQFQCCIRVGPGIPGWGGEGFGVNRQEGGWLGSGMGGWMVGVGGFPAWGGGEGGGGHCQSSFNQQLNNVNISI